MDRKYWTKGLGASLVASALFALTGCGGNAFHSATPPGFVELDDQEPDYHYRATSADGVVVAVREIKHEPKGDQEFWVQAIRNRMRERAGYALLDSRQVTTKSGLKGTQLRFGHDEEGESMLYTVTVFVTEDHIFLLEFGGSKDEMTRQAKHLVWVVDNFRLS